MTNRFPWLTPTLIVIGCSGLLSLSSCGNGTSPSTSDSSANTAPASPDAISNATTPGAATPTPAIAPSNPSLNSPTPTASPVAMTTVTVYKPDSQCETLLPEQVQVAGDRPMEAAIGKVIEDQSNADFSLAGYRVNLSAEGVVTVDLRLSPQAQRKIASLSTCEAFALFGSIRETLLKNSAWQVKSVRFTERGKEIVF